MATVAFKVLGTPRTSVGGVDVRVPAKTSALLGFLAETAAATPDERIERGLLASLLWPNSSKERARHSLSQCLYSLQRATDPHRTPVDIDGDYLWIGDCSCDLFSFHQSISKNAWEEASRLFRGPFLDGVDIRGGNDFQDWLDTTRWRYNQLVEEVLESLLVDEEWDLACELSTRFLAGNPFSEAGHLAKIRSLIMLGRDEQAETGLQEMKSLVVPATQDAVSISEIANSIIAQRGRNDRKISFVGRKKELQQLERIYRESIRSGSRVLILEGEPGIGKTSLLERFLKYSVLRGASVLMASGYEPERNVPFGIVSQWLQSIEDLGGREPWATVIERAFPGALVSKGNSGPDCVVERRPVSEITLPRLLGSLRRLMLHLASRRPLILSLDDGQYADSASLGFLHYLSRTASHAPILQLIGNRTPFAPLEAPSPVSEWRDAQRMELGPLSREEVAQILKVYSRDTIKGRVPLDWTESYIRKTKGNPFLILALLRHSDRFDAQSLPQSVVDFLQPQLNALSSEARTILNSLAVLGEPADQEALQYMSGLEMPRMVTGLRELEASGLTATNGGRVGLVHGLVGELAHATLPDSVRRLLFGRAARHLAIKGRSSPAVLAVHHDIAGDAHNALEAALTAAQASRHLHAHREREFFLKLALAHAKETKQRVEILLDLAELLTQTGRAAEAIDLLKPETVHDAPPPLVAAATAQRMLARLRLDSQVKEVFKEAPAALHDLRSVLDDVLMAKLYSALAAAAYDLGKRSACIEYGQRAASLAERLPGGPEASRILIRAVLVRAAYEGFERGSVALSKLEHLVDDSAESRALLLIGQGLVAILSGDLKKAEGRYLAAIELCERFGLYDTLTVVHNNLGVCYLEQGRYELALLEMQAVETLTPEGMAPRGTHMAVDNIVQLQYEVRNYRQGYDIAEQALARADKAGRSFFHLHGIRGLCALELGCMAAALESFREIDLALIGSEYWSNDISYVEIFLARMLTIQGKTSAAIERLSAAVKIYEPRDVLCKARMEAELTRHLVGKEPAEAASRAANLLRELEGSGATPLIDRVRGLAQRTG